MPVRTVEGSLRSEAQFVNPGKFVSEIRSLVFHRVATCLTIDFIFLTRGRGPVGRRADRTATWRCGEEIGFHRRRRFCVI
jgi:hypothetical protein